MLWLHILEAFPTPHLMEMHPLWDQTLSVLPMAQHWLPWFSFSSCWSGQHHSCAGSSTASQVALSSFPQGLHENCFLVHLSKSLAHFSHTVGLSQWSSSPSPLEPQPQGDGTSATLPREVQEAQNLRGHPSPKVLKLGPCMECVELPQLLHPQSEQ